MITKKSVSIETDRWRRRDEDTKDEITFRLDASIHGDDLKEVVQVLMASIRNMFPAEIGPSQAESLMREALGVGERLARAGVETAQAVADAVKR